MQNRSDEIMSAAALAVIQTAPDIPGSHDHITSTPLYNNTSRSVQNIWGFSHCVYVHSHRTVSLSIIISFLEQESFSADMT